MDGRACPTNISKYSCPSMNFQSISLQTNMVRGKPHFVRILNGKLQFPLFDRFCNILDGLFFCPRCRFFPQFQRIAVKLRIGGSHPSFTARRYNRPDGYPRLFHKRRRQIFRSLRRTAIARWQNRKRTCFVDAAGHPIPGHGDGLKPSNGRTFSWPT